MRACDGLRHGAQCVPRPHRITESLLLALATLVLCLAMPARSAEMSPHEAALYEAARKEAAVTWFASAVTGDVAEIAAKAFEARYPGIKANVVRATGQVVFQRVMQDQKVGVANCDVLNSTDISHFLFLKQKGLLAKYVPENAAKVGAAYRDIDPDGFYFVTSALPDVIAYNTDQVKPADVPKRWTDLTDPKWKNKVVTAHPAFSGAMGAWVVQMRKMYGWDYFKKLEANKPQVGRSLADPATVLSSGERAVGVAAVEPVLRAARKGNPVAVVYPEDGTLLVLSPSGILANAPHPNAAKLFMEFLLGVEYAQVMAEQISVPLRPEVPLPAGLKSMDEVTTIRPTEQEVEAGVPEIKELWRDTFGG